MLTPVLLTTDWMGSCSLRVLTVSFVRCNKLGVVRQSNIFHSAVTLQICFVCFSDFPQHTTVMSYYVHTCGCILACAKISVILRRWHQRFSFTFSSNTGFFFPPILTFNQTLSNCLDPVCRFYM